MKQVTIKNNFISLTVLDYGAIIQKLWIKDKDGNETNMVVGFDNPEDYLKDTFFLGACVGRFAGRISNGGFVLEGNTYPLHTKNGIHLHGGKEGFGKKYWTIEEVDQGVEPFIRLTYLSAHLEEGYPGKLRATVTYRLRGSALQIEHEAVTDKNTIVNLTNHSYFRMDNQDSIGHYYLRLNCPHFLETLENLLPTGKMISVENTQFDFQNGKRIGDIRLDTPFVKHPEKNEVAEVYSAVSGIRMAVTTNQPAVVVFTPTEFPGICFETQGYPDAPNQPSFPSCLLRPMERYYNNSVFTFDLVP